MKFVHLLVVPAVLITACNRSDSQRARISPEPVSSEIAQNWQFYNGSLNGDRYSPLDQITQKNVSQLKQVCTFDTSDTVSFQTGPVVIDGVLYATAFDNTYAIDASTCALKWRHSRPEPPTMLNVNRGVAFDGGRLFRGTGDAHVIAIDASSGKTVWDVAMGDPKQGESVPLAPIAWQGLVFAGNAGGDNYGVKGRVYALDAATGRKVWEFQTIPESGPAAATWQKASPRNPPTGGATWTTYALDPQSGVLFVTPGNPAPDFIKQMRPGDNLYANSLLAIDAKSGRLLDFVQPIRNDFHDWDLSAGPALIATKAGKAMIAAGGKDGHVYGIDRSGLASGVAPESNQPTASRALKIIYQTAVTTRENVDTPLTPDRETRFCPGSQGGIEWNGPAYSRDANLVFVNAIDWCTSVRIVNPATMRGKPGMAWTGSADPELPFGRMDPVDRWQGWLTAVDADTGEIRWKYRSPKPLVAAVTATAGGLVFTGDLDGNVRAFGASDGRELWNHATGKAIGGGVISYGVNGKQYVAVAAGLNSAIWPVNGGAARVIVYSLR